MDRDKVSPQARRLRGHFHVRMADAGKVRTWAVLLRKERRLMLKEILILVATVLPNWLVLVLMGFDRYARWKNKRTDRAGEH